MTPQIRSLLLVLTVLLGVLGIGAVAAAVVVPKRTTVSLPALSSTPATPQPSATPEAEPTEDPEAVEVALLADTDWIERTAASAGIPQRALAAYAGTALHLAEIDPTCGVGWSTLAGIGYVESRHGTLNDAQIDAEGVARPTIIGVPLDGDDVARVTDTDDGLLDNDASLDRAVGPMQFIPSSWELLGQDGNDDDQNDVNNIDDAALAAGIHLCEIGGNMTQPQGWINAITAYNDSVEYNNEVADAADFYATQR